MQLIHFVLFSFPQGLAQSSATDSADRSTLTTEAEEMIPSTVAPSGESFESSTIKHSARHTTPPAPTPKHTTYLSSPPPQSSLPPSSVTEGENRSSSKSKTSVETTWFHAGSDQSSVDLKIHGLCTQAAQFNTSTLSYRDYLIIIGLLCVISLILMIALIIMCKRYKNQKNLYLTVNNADILNPIYTGNADSTSHSFDTEFGSNDTYLNSQLASNIYSEVQL